MKKTHKIGTCRVVAGEITKGFLPIKSREGSLRIPLFTYSGKKSGATILIIGGVHGDEVNGMMVVHKLMSKIRPSKMKGTIIFIPSINPSGFKLNLRYTSEKHDLNRSYPGSNRTIASATAKKIFHDIVPMIDLGIDVHDGGHVRELFPQARVHMDEKFSCGSTKMLGGLFGTKFIYERRGDKGMFAVEVFKKYKKPILTLEIGGGSRIRKEFLDIAVNGIYNILSYMQVIKYKIVLPKKQYFFKDRIPVKSPISGICDIRVDLGQAVKKGDLLAHVYSPITTNVYYIKAPETGYIFHIRTHMFVKKNESVLSYLPKNTMHDHKHGGTCTI